MVCRRKKLPKRRSRVALTSWQDFLLKPRTQSHDLTFENQANVVPEFTLFLLPDESAVALSCWWFIALPKQSIFLGSSKVLLNIFDWAFEALLSVQSNTIEFDLVSMFVITRFLLMKAPELDFCTVTGLRVALTSLRSQEFPFILDLLGDDDPISTSDLHGLLNYWVALFSVSFLFANMTAELVTLLSCYSHVAQEIPCIWSH